MNDELAKKTIKVLVAEDYELARNGLCACLGNVDLLQIIEGAKNGKEAVEFTLKHHPDVVLMDIRMPVMDGITATRQIKEQLPNVKVIMLTSHQEGEEVYASLAAGAEAYCMKDIQMERLVEVIKMVADGAVWLDPAVAKMVMKALPMNLNQKSRTAQSRHRYNAELTDREREVLELLVAGKSNRDIADELSVTLHTVKAHVCNILQKLAVDDRTMAAVKAVRDGLVSAPEPS
jgi:DNA-binding NarL/FixJ family response regulator